MTWYSWLAIASLAICLAGCIYHLIRLIKLGKPKDYSRKSGSPGSGIIYSFTGAMNPVNKESAYLNLPTYIAGVIYHMGTFLAIILFFVFFFTTTLNKMITLPLVLFLFLSAIFGTGILFKRVTDKKLKQLSNPDDYISNMLVTGFQAATGIVLLIPDASYPVYMVIASLLLLYLPVGKLKHAIYFFAARYHIGYFYGWRNVWPAAKHSR